VIELTVGCNFEYHAQAESPAVVLVDPHSSVRDAVVEERWNGLDATRFEDLYGNVCRRLDLPEGRSSFGFEATVRVSAEPEPTPGPADVQHRIEDLPSEHLHWLLPSRLCEAEAVGTVGQGGGGVGNARCGERRGEARR